MYSRKSISVWFGVLAVTLAARAFADPPVVAIAGGEGSPGLRDATVLIIRHAEKPENGFELSPAGQQRAIAYANYFKSFTMDSRAMRPDYLFATADSGSSHRPRLTLEPLAKALGRKIDCRFKNKDFAALAREIRSTDHGKCILIAWHHGEIPELVQALGGDAATLLPGGKWPPQDFNWLLELSYDHEGRLIPSATKRINENLMPGDAKKTAN
jgi:hypothetical protein